MNKQLSLLNGLAILGVVLSHAAGWGQTAMTSWADYIRTTVDPNFTPVGSLAYYVLIAIRQITAFGVAGFLVASGWFIAYAVGSQPTLSWKVVRARLSTLLIPYLIWSVLSFIADYGRGIGHSFLDYLRILLVTQGAYFFVPLVCSLYLLSPFLVPWVRKHGITLLIAAGVIQLVSMSLEYMIRLGISSPIVAITNTALHDWAVPRWIFYYIFGLAAGFHAEIFRKWIVRVKWPVLASIIPLGALAVLESDLVYRATGATWGNTPIYLMVSLLAMAVISSFLAFPVESVAVSKALRWFGTRAYGLYLIHSRLMGFTGLLIPRLVPAIARQSWIFMLLQFLVGLGGPLLFMVIISKSPARKYYRYIFG